MWSLGQGLLSCLYNVQIVPAPFIEKTVLPPSNCFCIFVKNQLGYICVDIFLSFLFYFNDLSIPLPIPQCFNQWSYIYILDLILGRMTPSIFFLFFQYCFSHYSSINTVHFITLLIVAFKVLPEESHGLYSLWGRRVGHEWATFTHSLTMPI